VRVDSIEQRRDEQDCIEALIKAARPRLKVTVRE
jgi:hypothetical protein